MSDQKSRIIEDIQREEALINAATARALRYLTYGALGAFGLGGLLRFLAGIRHLREQAKLRKELENLRPYHYKKPLEIPVYVEEEEKDKDEGKSVGHLSEERRVFSDLMKSSQDVGEAYEQYREEVERLKSMPLLGSLLYHLFEKLKWRPVDRPQRGFGDFLAGRMSTTIFGKPWFLGLGVPLVGLSAYAGTRIIDKIMDTMRSKYIKRQAEKARRKYYRKIQEVIAKSVNKEEEENKKSKKAADIIFPVEAGIDQVHDLIAAELFKSAGAPIEPLDPLERMEANIGGALVGLIGALTLYRIARAISSQRAAARKLTEPTRDVMKNVAARELIKEISGVPRVRIRTVRVPKKKEEEESK